MSLQECCQSCRFWRTDEQDGHGEDEEHGFCHRRAPTVNYNIMRDNCNFNGFTDDDEEGSIPNQVLIRNGVFPGTYHNDWCGEYQSKD